MGAIGNWMAEVFGLLPPQHFQATHNTEESFDVYGDHVPAQLTPPTEVDYKYGDPATWDFEPVKAYVFPEDWEQVRAECMSSSATMEECILWVGTIIQDCYNGVPYNDVVWGFWTARLIAWLFTGTIPDKFPEHASDVRKAIFAWQGAPESVQWLMEPLITHWKTWIFYPDPGKTYLQYGETVPVRTVEGVYTMDELWGPSRAYAEG